MNNQSDFKTLSLELFGKEVELTLKENVSSFHFYNTNSLKGTLIGRVWGNKMIEKERDKVIAITVRIHEEEIQIPCLEIEHMGPARQ
jgi:hypothetical protein